MCWNFFYILNLYAIVNPKSDFYFVVQLSKNLQNREKTDYPKNARKNQA